MSIIFGETLLAATLTDPDKDIQLNIMNVYAPNSPREHQDFFDQYKPGDTNILLARDFNCVATPELDKQGENPDSGKQGIAELNQFVNNNDLHDTWRKSHPNERVYTWHNKDFTLRSRLAGGMCNAERRHIDPRMSILGSFGHFNRLCLRTS